MCGLLGQGRLGVNFKIRPMRFVRGWRCCSLQLHCLA